MPPLQAHLTTCRMLLLASYILIGVGYAAGPAAAMLGIALGGGAAIGWVVLAVLGATSWPALRPWLRSRK